MVDPIVQHQQWCKERELEWTHVKRTKDSYADAVRTPCDVNPGRKYVFRQLNYSTNYYHSNYNDHPAPKEVESEMHRREEQRSRSLNGRRDVRSPDQNLNAN